MGKIINVDQPTWSMMLMLKDNVKGMRSRNEEGKFDIAIRKETAMFKSFLNEVLGSKAA